MQKKLVLKITLLSCLVLIIFSVISCSVLAYNDNKIISSNLIDLASTYAQALEVSDPDTLVKTDRIAETRITVMDMSGRVVADSYGGEAAMENHLNRQEVINAMSGNNDKVTKRYSDTANTTLMYYAIKVSSGGEEYYLRVSRRAADVTVYLATSIAIVITSTIVLALIVSLLSDRFARTTMRPLGELADNLEAVSEGTFRPIMPHKGSDEMNMLISKVNDIGELLAENLREIRVEKDKLGYLLENMSQAVIALDHGDNVMFYNSRAEELFGTADMHGINVVTALHERLIIDKYKSIKTYGIELFIWEKNNKYYRISINKLQNTDNELKSIILISDITKLKLAELERKQFFANCSHELKTPLTAIKGYGELVAGGIAQGDKIIEYNLYIVKEADSLLSMINDMLILSRLDENIDSGVKSMISVADVITKVVDSYRVVIDDKSINITMEGDGEAYLSRENLFTILSNVISNAIKYNNVGGAVNITTTESRGGITITISDNGIGIAKKDIPRVTERFYRADEARTAGDSSGLGLAIVKHLCANNNIKLKINSTLGKGTEVILRFSKVKLNDELE